MTANRPVIVGLGEILWDLFPSGPRFGGAPANFACHAAALGAEAHMVSAVGNDPLGEKALAALTARGVGTSAVQRNEYATGTVNVQLDSAGQPSYTFAEDTAWDHLAANDSARKLLARAAAVCFGTLARRSEESRAAIEQLLGDAPPELLRVYDVNLRAPYYDDAVILALLPQANVLKLNREELEILARLTGLRGSEREIAAALNERYNLKLTAVTRGAEGSLLVDAEGQSHETVSRPSQIIDTVGAGDSFTAALVVGLLRDLPLATVHEFAARLAAYVCTQPGATPEIPGELRLPE